MNEKLTQIKLLINKGELETAINQLSQLIETNKANDEPYYLLGNAYRKQGNWQLALNNYLSAKTAAPEYPAVQSHYIF